MISNHEENRMTTRDKRLFWLLIAVILILMGLAAKPARAHEEELFCPVDYPECYPFDFMEELERAHMLDISCVSIGSRGNSERRRRIRRWEINAIEIIMSGALGKSPIDIVPTDGGAHGFAHFQPPNDLNISWMEHYEADDDIPECIRTSGFNHDDDWVSDIERVLYSRYSVAIQLTAWRSGVSRAVAEARRNGWEENHWTIAAAIANSTGQRGFINLAGSAGWDPELTIQAYTDQRPDSRHRRRRARRMRQYL